MNCRSCGVEFVGYHNRRFCDGCGRKRQLASGRECMRRARERDPEGLAAYQRKYVQEHPELYKNASKRSKLKLRGELVAAYGGRCSCSKCPETNTKFLTIDHIFDDGAEQRKAGQATGHALYIELKRLGFPKDRYRLLCYNCNIGRNSNGGTCPHEE